jgi:uncharacterized Zn-finger protein
MNYLQKTITTPYFLAVCLFMGFITIQPMKRERPHEYILKIKNPKKKQQLACIFCDTSFPDNSSLERHVLVHNHEKPYPCTYNGCGKSFKQQCHLVPHLRTHTREKPYICNICGKTFNQKSNCITHIKKQHIIVATALRFVTMAIVLY